MVEKERAQEFLASLLKNCEGMGEVKISCLTEGGTCEENTCVAILREAGGLYVITPKCDEGVQMNFQLGANTSHLVRNEKDAVVVEAHHLGSKTIIRITGIPG